MPSPSTANDSIGVVYTTLAETHYTIDILYKENESMFNGRSVELAVHLQRQASRMQFVVDPHAAFLASRSW